MPVKAVIFKADDNPRISIPVMFNPPEYQVSKRSNYAITDIPNRDEGYPQWLSGGSQELSLELFFDTTDVGVDVRRITTAITKLAEINPVLKRPPRLLFVWGMMVFECVMTGYTQKFEYFDSAGQALRARMNVTLVGYDRLWKNFDSGGAAPSAGVVISKAGDTVQSIAAAASGNAKDWKRLARENNIENPLNLQPGSIIKLPLP